jgi:glycosyltransferase involved in cell wall biosynthesis
MMASILHRPVGAFVNKLRLVHVIQILDPEGGGAVAAVKSTCAALAEQGHEVTLYATDRHPKQAGESKGYRTVAFPMEFPPMAISLGFARAFSRLKDVDLVHIHQLYRFPQSFAAFFCRRHGIPYCIQPHGSLDPVVYFKRERRATKRLYERWIERRNLENAAGIIYTARGEKEAADFLNLPTPPFIVPLGLHLSEFEQGVKGFRDRYGLKDRELVVWMGRLVPVKGLDILLRAFAELASQRPNAVLVLVGPDTENYAVVLQRIIKDIGLSPDRVVFTGLLRGEEKLAALKEADLFVLPSYTENFALAAMEALAMGCPVVISDRVKIAPDIAQAEAGLVIAPREEELVSAMISLLSDQGRRHRMRKAALAFVRQYDWPVVVGKLETAYRTMIAA